MCLWDRLSMIDSTWSFGIAVLAPDGVPVQIRNLSVTVCLLFRLGQV
jgi:hypothetical protein